MILTRKVKININARNIKHLKSLGYENLKIKNSIIIPIEHLTDKSDHKIEVRCDVCSEKMIRCYREYKKSFDNGGYFACSNKCSYEKKQKTFMKNYGVNHLMQSKEIQEINKHKNLEKYGVEFVSQIQSSKEKSKNTCLLNYGVDNPSKSEQIKKKKIETCNKNFGVDYSFQSKEMRKKSMETCIKKYGVKHPLQILSFKKKL